MDIVTWAGAAVAAAGWLAAGAAGQTYVAVDLQPLLRQPGVADGLLDSPLSPSLELAAQAGVAYDGATLDGRAVFAFDAEAGLEQATQQLERAAGTSLQVSRAPQDRDRLRAFISRVRPGQTFPREVGALRVERRLRNLPYVRLVTRGDAVDPATLMDLRSLGAAVRTEPDHRLRLDGAPSAPALPTSPNDLWFPEQWGLEEIGAPLAWDCFTGDADVVVAIDPPNGLDDDGNGIVDDTRGWDVFAGDADPQDELGHGTRVAGVVGACTHNGLDVAGVTWEVSLMSLRAFSATEDGAWAFAEASKIMEALQYAAEEGALVVNCSFGGANPEMESLHDTMKALPDVLFVCSAGNTKQNIDPGFSPRYPASFELENVVTVMAVELDAAGDLLEYAKSAYGPTAVDLGAPGAGVVTTDLGGGTAWDSGTSMAAPMVTGAAALMLGSAPCAGTERGGELRELLLANARLEGALLNRCVSHGLVQVGFLASCPQAPCVWKTWGDDPTPEPPAPGDVDPTPEPPAPGDVDDEPAPADDVDPTQDEPAATDDPDTTPDEPPLDAGPDDACTCEEPHPGEPCKDKPGDDG